MRTVIKAVETGTYKLSRNILRNWVFSSKLIHEVQAVNTGTAELETI